MRVSQAIGRAWSRILYNYPVTVFVSSIIMTAVLPLCSLYFVPVKLSANAEVGFDTKDTPYSGQRLAWKRLSKVLTTTNRVQLYKSPSNGNSTVQSAESTTPATVSRDKRGLEYLGGSFEAKQAEDIEKWVKKTEEYNANKQLSSAKRHKRSWSDKLLTAFSNVPCYEAPIPLMNHLSQFIIELPTYNDIWDVNFLRKLCGMQNGIEDALKPFEAYTPYRNIWSVANFFACLSPNLLVNCTQLTQEDVDTVHALVTECQPYRRKLIDCKVACGENCQGPCAGVPKNCSTTMMFDLFYRLLPVDRRSRPFYLNTFLPVFTRMGYSTQNIYLPLQHYDVLETAIKNYTQQEGLKLKGLLMELKRDRLLAAAIQDSFFSLLAAGLVILCVALYSRSPSYAIAVLVQLALSVVAALGIYAHFTSDFPLLNLVIFVLLIAVGSDDAFLLFSHFPDKLSFEGFHSAVAHTGATMFLTSFSTAVPFFVNILSNVIVFRCFGLFAGLTIIVNYLLVISFLPSFLIIQRRSESFISFALFENALYFNWCPSLPDFSHCLTRSTKEVLPQVIIQGRWVWLSSLSVLVIGCGVIAFNDLSLPQYNPLQLFTADNPHEWYDNHAEPLYEFVASKIAIPLHARLVWGIKPIESTARFREAAQTPLEADPKFSIASVPDVRRLARSLKSFRSLPFVNHTEPYWPEQFLIWSSRYVCQTGFLCCNVSSPIFTNAFLDYCLRNSTSYIFTQYNDTPIFDADNFNLIGYTALLPTKLKYSHRFRNLSASIDVLDGNLHMEGGWQTTEWVLMSVWFDLQRSIVLDCQSSVLISLAVVAFFAVVHLRWQAIPSLITICAIIIVSVGLVVLLGWVIGVLEAVILVLVVGLSFDYTLHYGASLPQHGCRIHRVAASTALSISPVSLAATTSMIAGAAMLFCKTHAFFQVGVFLVVSMSISWLFATFFFLPLLTFTLARKQECMECQHQSQSIPLNQKF